MCAGVLVPVPLRSREPPGVIGGVNEGLTSGGIEVEEVVGMACVIGRGRVGGLVEAPPSFARSYSETVRPG